ncbi:hydroxymethylglutaryl-CoA reductase [Methylomonas sp. SURF-1]|uniref:hydroxymethylglutaryl-CoA reductase (NADPH) n=1 Tax=Methylomonas aurea TaxID=2952224 RepID=A0ABT1UEB6_9GAMM|nr:hydroxymethylglutaryl-CoA reductase [Methylomonas sp. SURF-1]MCQ8179751.1 hydroxymethylglutaryl-CoA reductase [Methylomonas sp. SURF-1]
MSISRQRANQHLSRLLESHSLQELASRLAPRSDTPAISIPKHHHTLTSGEIAKRWHALGVSAEIQAQLLDPQTEQQYRSYQHNIENFIGTVKVPVGLVGPLRVNGLFAQGDFVLPLATTEAALVASYSRGAQLITEAGGCTAMLLSEGVSRAPGFAFENLRDAGLFVAWAVTQEEQFRLAAERTTRHGKLADLEFTVEGNHVYLRFQFLTGDAAGQNMVTIATQAICDYIIATSPLKPKYYFLEANFSGDKKASLQSFLAVRGKKVTAEVLIPGPMIKTHLHTSAAAMVDHWRMAAIGGVLSGTIGVQGHYANGLAALYLACGQDVACVAESAVGVTRFEQTENHDLYAAVTLPNLIVGSVGGGTGLPSQHACLEIAGFAGADKAQAFAETCAALCLAGELSIVGALCAGDFARAHQKLARG